MVIMFLNYEEFLMSSSHEMNAIELPSDDPSHVERKGQLESQDITAIESLLDYISDTSSTDAAIDRLQQLCNASTENKQYIIARINDRAIEHALSNNISAASALWSLIIEFPYPPARKYLYNDTIAQFNLAKLLHFNSQKELAINHLRYLKNSENKTGFKIKLSELIELEKELTSSTKNNFGLPSVFFGILLAAITLPITSVLSTLAAAISLGIIKGGLPKSLLSIITIPFTFAIGVIVSPFVAVYDTLKGIFYDVITNGAEGVAKTWASQLFRVFKSLLISETGHSLYGPYLRHHDFKEREYIKQTVDQRPVGNSIELMRRMGVSQTNTETPVTIARMPEVTLPNEAPLTQLFTAPQSTAEPKESSTPTSKSNNQPS